MYSTTPVGTNAVTPKQGLLEVNCCAKLLQNNSTCFFFPFYTRTTPIQTFHKAIVLYFCSRIKPQQQKSPQAFSRQARDSEKRGSKQYLLKSKSHILGWAHEAFMPSSDKQCLNALCLDAFCIRCLSCLYMYTHKCVYLSICRQITILTLTWNPWSATWPTPELWKSASSNTSYMHQLVA